MNSRSKTRFDSYDGLRRADEPFTTTLGNPLSWAAPKLIVPGDNGWYPQVIDITAGQGTDNQAGVTAGYFVLGNPAR